MWLTLLPTLLLVHASWATLYSEGGPQELYYENEDYVPRESIQYDPEKLAEIIEELNREAELQRQREQQVYNQYDDRANAMEIELLKPELTDKPMSAQKKGQSEFVEFIEPKSSKQLQKVETLEKRVPAQQASSRSSYLIHRGNLLFVAVATVCVVGAAVGVAGGAYYYNVARAQRAAAERSDFTHYAPTGPGKEKKKKRGDESLAYKAQLHHYQQTKQKIISGEELGAGMPDNDETSEASDDEGNNFSVYECPGLAPTGDIEVQNPNFDSRP